MATVSRPLLDRIDLHIEVPAANYKDLARKETGGSSKQIREGVICAREIQNLHYGSVTVPVSIPMLSLS